jgi:hypothetical protein
MESPAAMAVSLGLFAAALVAMPLWGSPHLVTPAQYTQRQCDAWLASRPLRQHVVYQSASRYRLFQWHETALPDEELGLDRLVRKVYKLKISVQRGLGGQGSRKRSCQP